MKPQEWKTYRTRFLVKAKQLSSALSFVDNLGRQHCGRKGDYLVESSDGVISIAPRQIFEDIYVPISLAVEDNPPQVIPEKKPAAKLDESRREFDQRKFDRRSLARRRFEPLQIEELKTIPASADRRCVDTPSAVRQLPPAAVRRKLPQPFSDRRVSAARLRLM